MAVNLSPVGGVAAQFFDNDGNVLSGGKIYTYAAGTSTPATVYTSSNGSIAHSNPIVLDSAGRVPTGEIWLTDGINYKFVLNNSIGTLIGTYDNISGINSNFISFTNSQEIQTATAGQTVFTLTTMQYQVGTNSLSVFVDGVNQYGPSASYAYTETSSTSVTFVNGLHVGALVKFTSSQQQGAGAVNASQVAYNPAGTGAVTTNVQAKLRQYVSVKDFGAVGDGTTNDTAAIQAALNASRYVVVPIGTYRLESTITVPANTRLEFQGGTNIVSPPPAVFFKAHSGVGISLGASCIISGGGIYSNKTTYPTGNGVNMLGSQSTIENFAINDVGGVGIRLGSVSTYVNTNSCQLTNIKIYGCGSDGIYIHDAFGSDSNAHTITSCVVIACNGHGIRLNRTFWATVINCNVEICTGYGLYLSGETVPNDPDCRYANIFGGDYNEGNTAGPIFDNSYFPFIQIADVNAKPTNARSGAGSILQFLGGTQNELYGLTSTSGIKAVAVHTQNLTNIALATGVAATILNATQGGYLVTAYLNGYGNDSCASALVVYSGTGSVFVSANNSTYLTITGSGTSVQLTQTKAANATGVYTFLKLGQI